MTSALPMMTKGVPLFPGIQIPMQTKQPVLLLRRTL